MNLNLVKSDHSYIIDPYHVLWYGSMKLDGTMPIIKIGKYCSIAHNCTFVMSHHAWTRVTTSPCYRRNLFEHQNGNMSSYCRGDIDIGNDVWIGANCTIMDNVTIGDGAVVAACSLITKDVPPYSIVGGTPANLIKYRFSVSQIEKLKSIAWWDLPSEVLETLDLWTEDIDGFIEKARCAREQLAH